MFVRTLGLRLYFNLLFVPGNWLRAPQILQLRFAAYKRHYINLNSSPIDWKYLFAYMGVGLVILNLPAILENSKSFFFGKCFFLCNLVQIAYAYAIIIIADIDTLRPPRLRDDLIE
jgi:hypothetical protein